MKTLGSWLCVLLLGVILCAVAFPAYGQANDEKEIRNLEERFAAAFRAKNVNAIMACYVPDESLFVFDVLPPRQYVGAKAYKKDWEGFFAAFPGPLTFDLSDLRITADRRLGFSHSIQHVVLTDKDGNKLDFTVRVTDGYRKVNGKWLVVHEHVSVPVDLATAKADITSKP
jgi:uncharacterized protein (TIGR02246 family)